MNMFKKNGGFTLVELIVVIAILAILAGIAVPAYSGYIKKAEQAADVQMLSPIATAAQGLAIEKNTNVEKITVAAKGTTITVDLAEGDDLDKDDVVALTGELTFTDNFPGATWTKGTNKWVVGTPAT